MKRVLRILRLPAGLVLCLAALTALSCDAGVEASLAVLITQQPVGGSNVNTVSCTFEGTISCPEKASTAIAVSTHWESPHGTYNEEVHTWEWLGIPQTKTITSSKSAPSGMHLDKPFWLVISWRDAGGTHRVVSDTAYCE